MKFSKFLIFNIFFILVISPLINNVPKANAAEEIKITYSIFARTIKVNSLKTFAKEGKSTRELKRVLKATGSPDKEIRAILNKDFEVPITIASKLVYSEIGNIFLTRLSSIIHPPRANDERTGMLALRASVIQGINGWLTIVPFVLLVSLIMNSLIDNQNGSNPLLEIVLNNNNYLSFFLLFVTTTLLAPLFEEIIFRGILLPTLSREFGVISGIIVSAFIFALAHLSLGEMPPLFVLGIGLAITRIASGSLFSSVIMHSLWNGLTFLNLFLLRT